MQIRWRLNTAPLVMLCIPLGFLCTQVTAAGQPDAKPSGTLSGHSAAVRGVAFSPDGKTLASVGLDGTARLWDPTSGKGLAVLGGHPSGPAASADRAVGVYCLAFTPDGKVLATGSSDGSVMLWDLAGGRQRRVLSGHTAGVRCLAISRNGKILASGSDDRTVKLWQVDTGASKGTLSGHGGGLTSVAFDAAGQIVSAGWDASVRRWDADSGKQLAEFPMDLAVLALASGAKVLAAGHALGPISLWDCSADWTRRTLAGHGSNVSAAVFAGNGKTLASADMDGTIAVWQVATGRRLQAFVHAHGSGVWGVAFSPDGRTLASAGEDHDVKLWDASPFNPPATVPDHDRPATEPPRPAQPQPGEIEAVAAIKRLGGRFLAKGSKASWSPDGTRVIFGDRGGLKILDSNTGKISGLAAPGKDPAWSPGDGRHVAYVRPDAGSEAIWLVEAVGGSPRKLAQGSFPSWSADGKTLMFYSAISSKLQSMSANVKGAPVTEVLGVSCPNPATSWDGKLLAYQSGRQLLVVGRETGKTLCTWPVSDKDGCLPGWSPDGKRLAFGGQRDDACTGLWVLDIERKQGVRVALGPVTMPGWSADGSKLAFDVRLRDGPEIWMIETRNLEAIQPQVPAAGRCSVPEAVERLVGPMHRPRGQLVYVDLGKHANFQLAKGTVQDNHLAELPRGEQTFAGVKFRVGETGIHLASTRLPTMPRTVQGIPIHRRAIVLYILHATQWGVPQYSVLDGMTIGHYQVHYVDGTAATIPIVCGQDVRDWWSRSEKPVTRGQVVWAGRNPSASQENFYIRLYLTTWENPHPEKAVATIDYNSMMTDAAPFCVAMTTEDPGPTRPAPHPATSRR